MRPTAASLSLLRELDRFLGQLGDAVAGRQGNQEGVFAARERRPQCLKVCGSSGCSSLRLGCQYRCRCGARPLLARHAFGSAGPNGAAQLVVRLMLLRVPSHDLGHLGDTVAGRLRDLPGVAELEARPGLGGVEKRAAAQELLVVDTFTAGETAVQLVLLARQAALVGASLGQACRDAGPDGAGDVGARGGGDEAGDGGGDGEDGGGIHLDGGCWFVSQKVFRRTFFFFFFLFL